MNDTEPTSRGRGPSRAFEILDPLGDVQTWATEPTHRCGLPQIHRHRHLRHRHRVVLVFCWSWACARCGPRLRETWLKHLARVLAGVDGPVWVALIPRQNWERDRRHINRRHGQYVRFNVPGPSELLVVVTTVPVEGGFEVTIDDALALVGIVVRGIPLDQRRISTSRAWSRAEAEHNDDDVEGAGEQAAEAEEDADSQWERVGTVDGSIRDVSERLDHLGIWGTTDERNLDEATSIEFRIPDDIEVDSAAYGSLLAVVSAGPHMAGLARAA